MGGVAPDDEENDSDQNQGEAEANPEAERSHVVAEGEPSAKRKADDPVGSEMAEHRRARIARAAKRSGSGRLDSVEKLKRSACGQQNSCRADYNGIRRIDAGDPTGKDKKDDAGEGHEDGAEEDSGVAGGGRATRVFAADGLADANSCGAGDAERNHVSERHGVQSNLVSRKWHGSEARDQRRDEGKDAAFERKLHCGGKAKNEQSLDARKVEIDGRLQKFGAVLAVVPEQIDDKHERHVGAGERRGPAGADDAHVRQAPLTVDQRVIADGIDDVRGDQREGDRPDHVHGLDAAA